jgi:hypothetical protein
MAHVNAQPIPLAMLAPSAPAFLVAVCDRAMAKDPAARRPSAAALARLLRVPGPVPVGEAAAATRPLPVAAAAPATRRVPAVLAAAPPGRPARRRPRRRGLLVALLLAGWSWPGCRRWPARHSRGRRTGPARHSWHRSPTRREPGPSRPRPTRPAATSPTRRTATRAARADPAMATAAPAEPDRRPGQAALR